MTNMVSASGPDDHRGRSLGQLFLRLAENVAIGVATVNAAHGGTGRMTAATSVRPTRRRCPGVSEGTSGS
jgi:hypothetical protein